MSPVLHQILGIRVALEPGVELRLAFDRLYCSANEVLGVQSMAGSLLVPQHGFLSSVL